MKSLLIPMMHRRTARDSVKVRVPSRNALRPAAIFTRQGFTLIELLVVIAIIAVLIGLLLEAVESKDANEQKAQQNIDLICAAQHTFRSQNPTYANSLSELFNAGLIDATLATGMKSGYFYTIFYGDKHNFFAVAYPKEPGVTGDLILSIDKSCQSQPTIHPDAMKAKIVIDFSGTQMQGIAQLLRGLDAETQSWILREAKTLVQNEYFMELVQRGFDHDGDGRLALDELLDTDLFALSQIIASEIFGEERGLDILPRSVVQKVLDGLNASLREDFRPILDDETLRPAPVPFEEMEGDPVSILGTYQSLRAMTRHFVANPGVAQSLQQHLDAAEAAEERGGERAKSAHLEAYRTQLATHAGSFLSETDSRLLIILSQGL